MKRLIYLVLLRLVFVASYDAISTACAKVSVSQDRKRHASAEDGSSSFKLREKWAYALDRDGLTAALTKDYNGNKVDRESVYLLDEFERSMTGKPCFTRARAYLEVCVLESPFIADTPTAIFSIGQSSSRSSGQFNVTAVVRQAVHGQIAGLEPGELWLSASIDTFSAYSPPCPRPTQ
jgi:hypothetical protein